MGWIRWVNVSEVCQGWAHSYPYMDTSVADLSIHMIHFSSPCICKVLAFALHTLTNVTQDPWGPTQQFLMVSASQVPLLCLHYPRSH